MAKSYNKVVMTGDIDGPTPVLITETGLFDLVPVTPQAIRNLQGPRQQVQVTGHFARRRVEDGDKSFYRTEILATEIGPKKGPLLVNFVEVGGHLGREPHIAYPAAGDEPVVSLAVATNDARPDPKNPGKWLPETTWHKAVAKGEDALHAVQEMKKGSFVRLQGELRQRRGRFGAMVELQVHAINGRDLLDPAIREEQFQRLLAKVHEGRQEILPLLIEEPEIIIINFN